MCVYICILVHAKSLYVCACTYVYICAYICVYLCMLSHYMCVCVHICIYVHMYHFGHVLLFVILWTVAHQAPLSTGFSRQEHQSGWPCPPPGVLPDPGTEHVSLMSPIVAGRFYIYTHTYLLTYTYMLGLCLSSISLAQIIGDGSVICPWC